MTGTLTAPKWIDALREHYLAEYIRGGGSTVKFAVCFPGVDHRAALKQLGETASNEGYLVVNVDAAVTRVHLIEQLLAQVSDQLSWGELTDNILSQFAKASSWNVPDRYTDEEFVKQIDRLNGVGEQQISLELQRRIARDVLGDRSLAKDFRMAMTWMLRARVKGGDDGIVIPEHITSWLGGRIRTINELRQYQIFTKVSRANARHILGSLLEWVRRSGRPGVVVLIDAFRLLEPRRQTDGSVNYTKATLLDAYEVFRQFIDSTDQFDGFMLVVQVPETFVELELKGRGLLCYSALQSRVYDDVRDRSLANPLTALIRLTADGGEVL